MHNNGMHTTSVIVLNQCVDLLSVLLGSSRDPIVKSESMLVKHTRCLTYESHRGRQITYFIEV